MCVAEAAEFAKVLSGLGEVAFCHEPFGAFWQGDRETNQDDGYG